MIQAQQAVPGLTPALLRLSRLAALTDSDLAALQAAEAGGKTVRSRREILAEGQEVGEARLIVSGWAARVRLFQDGRRQFLSFLLPGDLIGCCSQPHPLAVSTVTALTDTIVATAPMSDVSPALHDAYAMSRALDEAYLLAQIVRLGRLNAQERMADLFLELHERLALSGMTADGGFDFPLTQESLGDALGLTSVHINRMLQLLRKDGDVIWKHGRLTLRDPAGLAKKIGRPAIRVSGAA